MAEIINDDFISIERLINQQIDKREKENIRRVVSFLMETVRGLKVHCVNGAYVIPEEYDRMFPEDINYVLDLAIERMRVFKLHEPEEKE